MWRALCYALMLFALRAAAAEGREPPAMAMAPPAIQALLAEAWSEERRPAGLRDDELVVALYCEAARHGSPEGHYRAALAYLGARDGVRDETRAKFFLNYAHELGHQAAAAHLGALRERAMRQPECLTAADSYRRTARFDFGRYLGQIPSARRDVAALVARLAPEYGIDADLALAVAAVESNFDTRARSPANAQGVMQLIPATAERFGVRDVWHPEDNIRGGLAYLRWLKARFGGDLEKVVAAYNAGEGAVDRHGGVPPYYETRAYVFRVLNFARSGATRRGA